jgi:hypothetical protein
MITVAGEQRVQIVDFSGRFQEVIKLIPNGMDWMNWALPVSRPSFTAASEAALLENIQAGLHGTPLLSLSDLGIQLNISRLLELDDQDYQFLEEAVGQGLMTREAEGAFRREQFLTEKDFAELKQRVEQAGLRNAPLLQNLSLGERIILRDRIMSIPSNEWPGGETEPGASDVPAVKAGNFARAVAQSPREVGAALSFFCYVKQKGLGADQQIGALWTHLSQLAFDFLRCPMIPTHYSDEWATLSLRKWIGQGNLLGFATIADAIVNVARFSGINLAPDQVDPKSVEQYVLRAQRFLQTVEPVSRWCQDGIVRWLEFQAQDASARVLLDEDACLSLFEFRESNPTQQG